MHRARLFAATALLLVAAAAPLHAGEAGAARPRLQPLEHSTLDASGARLLRRASWSGGQYLTQSGDRVTVFVSTTYADADAIGLRWANFLASLVHGPELEVVRVHIVPLSELAEFCGAALGCYGSNRVVSIGEAVDGVTPDEVMRHEYGHHVAAHRLNAPWSAIAWGPKRWASKANVCGRVARRTAFPGDQGLGYQLNPGEAFAEAYRVLNELRGGAPTFAWELADVSFTPDASELAAVEADVLRPWSPTVPRLIGGRFGGRARTWTRSVSTLLDGDLTVTLRLPFGAGHTLELLDDRGAVVAKGAWSASGVRTVRYRVCGARKLAVRVHRAGAPPRFTLRIDAP